MRRLKLYLETTVWNFSFADDAPQYRQATLDFFDRARLGLYDLYYSEAVLDELEDASEPRRGQMLALVSEIAPQLLPTTVEAERLTRLYLERGALPAKKDTDALHVALATVHQMDVLVSWNIKHLASVARRDRVMAINLEQGYSHPLNLVPPMMLTEVENGEA